MQNQPFYYGQGPFAFTYPYGQVPFDFQEVNSQLTASGNIYPSRFVTISGSNLVKQCGLGDLAYGVTQQNTARPLGPYAVTPGYPVQIYGIGQDCWLMLGGTVTAGDYLRSDAQGRGIVCNGPTPTWGSAKSYESGTVGQLVRVKVMNIGPIPPTCGFSEFDFEYDYEFGVPCDQ